MMIRPRTPVPHHARPRFRGADPSWTRTRPKPGPDHPQLHPGPPAA